MYKKSQASLEFLTTYAWAFLMIAVSIGALYYFGVFDFTKYQPQKCAFPSQFKCTDFSLSTAPNEVKVKLVNNLGEEIEVTSLSITNDANPPILCLSASPEPPFNWEYSTEKDIVFSACSGGGFISDNRVELKISLRYYAINTPSRPIHTINGKINGRVI
ncbi:MAG: hypothetical protein AABX33_02730 [Nanoarchaeota archaeon]